MYHERQVADACTLHALRAYWGGPQAPAWAPHDSRRPLDSFYQGDGPAARRATERGPNDPSSSAPAEDADLLGYYEVYAALPYEETRRRATQDGLRELSPPELLLCAELGRQTYRPHRFLHRYLAGGADDAPTQRRWERALGAADRALCAQQASRAHAFAVRRDAAGAWWVLDSLRAAPVRVGSTRALMSALQHVCCLVLPRPMPPELTKAPRPRCVPRTCCPYPEEEEAWELQRPDLLRGVRDLFRCAVAAYRGRGVPVSLSAFDLFHAHVASPPGDRGVSALFHAREYPRDFPGQLGYCQQQSDIDMRQFRRRNLQWTPSGGFALLPCPLGPAPPLCTVEQEGTELDVYLASPSGVVVVVGFGATRYDADEIVCVLERLCATPPQPTSDPSSR